MSADAQGDRLPADQVELAVEVFRMLADATRIQLLWALLEAELSVNDLAAAVGKPGPSVSQHLAKLRMARLVRTRREGNQVFYRLENDHVANWSATRCTTPSTPATVSPRTTAAPRPRCSER